MSGPWMAERAAAGDAADLSELAALAFPLACPEDIPSAAIAQHITVQLSLTAFTADLARPDRELWVVRSRTASGGLGRDWPPPDDLPALLGYLMLVCPGSERPCRAGSIGDRDDDRTMAGSRPSGIPAGRWVELRRIYVHPDWLGAGVGEALMARAVQRCDARGWDGLWLGTSQRNDRALRFYRRWGFRIVGERTFTVGGVPNDDWVLVRP